MALILAKDAVSDIEVIAKKDSAVKCSRDVYDSYLESFKSGQGDESLLELDGEPTRFVIKTRLSYEEETNLSRSESKILDGKIEMSGVFLSETFRMSLKDIVNPANMPVRDRLIYKKEGSGGCSKALMTMLSRAGIVTDLTQAWANAKAGQAENEDELDPVEKKD